MMLSKKENQRLLQIFSDVVSEKKAFAKIVVDAPMVRFYVEPEDYDLLKKYWKTRFPKFKDSDAMKIEGVYIETDFHSKKRELEAEKMFK